jgi:hypothetical protein
LGVGNIGELRCGQSQNGHGSRNNHDYGNDHGNDRAIDEEFRHGIYDFESWMSRGWFRLGLAFLIGLRIDPRALFHLLNTFGYDAIAGFETLVDHPH